MKVPCDRPTREVPSRCPGTCASKSAINSVLPELLITQKINLALLVSAILKKQTLCLSELARAYPVPDERRVESHKHCLLHRLKRLWRFTSFTNNERVDALRIQLAFVEHTIASPSVVERLS